jgi:hypothetical protein
LGDFGLAFGADRVRLTQDGTFVGTAAYIAPEQAMGAAADARSDLYALGCVLYEMVTGRVPFAGNDMVSVISQHIETAPVAPSWHNPQVPRALDALILQLLAKSPEDRPQSADALLSALNAVTTTSVPQITEAPAANPLDRLAAGVFVGREREVDELRRGLDDALSGRGQLLLLVGEPGIGKTRTASELCTYARLRGAQVLIGRCYEGEGAPAYWPWMQAMRSYIEGCDAAELQSEMGPGAADVAQMVPEVHAKLPGLTAPPAIEPDQARFRLFDSITTFLKNASRRQPLVLLLDDLHWADKASLLMLQFLARDLSGARLLVLGTYRDVELGRQHPLAQTLAELARAQVGTRVLLRGLGEPEVARYIEMTAGRKPSATLVAAVFRETEGNPFFVSEVVRLLVADGRLQESGDTSSWTVAIPQSVREVVGRRLDRLSEECHDQQSQRSANPLRVLRAGRLVIDPRSTLAGVGLAVAEIVLELGVKLAEVVVEPGGVCQVATAKRPRENMSTLRHAAQVLDEVVPFAKLIRAVCRCGHRETSRDQRTTHVRQSLSRPMPKMNVRGAEPIRVIERHDTPSVAQAREALARLECYEKKTGLKLPTLCSVSKWSPNSDREGPAICRAFYIYKGLERETGLEPATLCLGRTLVAGN